MTKLRERMLEDLQLRGYSERTQQMYVRVVRLLSEHYGKSPDQITEEELRDYFLHVKNIKKWSRTASTISLCGIKFFYENTLKRDWPTLTFVRPQPEKRLPVILTQEEIRRILECVRFDRYRVCLFTIYTCGLRLKEGCELKVSDIDSGRMVVHVEQGKGSKDRYVPLPQRTLEELRTYKAGLISGRRCAPCAILTPPIWWNRASTCVSSRNISATTRHAPPPSMPI